jgi:hypothetical protein
MSDASTMVKKPHGREECPLNSERKKLLMQKICPFPK